MLGPSKGKDFDTGNVMGPWLVTADEIPDPGALTMSVWINGEERCRGTSADMMHSFADIIEMEVSGLGRLRNRVVFPDS